MQPLSIKKEDKILVVAPHPDDECIGVGGLLSIYDKQCDIVIMTDGRQGQGNMSMFQTKEIRYQEFLKEMEMISINKYTYLAYEDGSLMNHLDALAEFDLVPYTKIFVTGDRDNHPDHTAAFLCVLNGIKKQKKKPEIYLYEVHRPLENPNYFLDISDVLHKKIELIQCHKSQISVLPYQEMAEALSKYRALQNRMCQKNIETYESWNKKEVNINNINLEIELQKQREFYLILTRWLKHKINGYFLGQILEEKGYKNIVIYGYAELGKLLYYELKKSEALHIMYILDKKLQDPNKQIFIPNSDLEKPDCVIVTAVFYFEEIKKELLSLGYKNSISLKELVVENESNI